MTCNAAVLTGVCVCVCLLQVIRRYSDFDVLNNSLMVSSSHELHDSK